MGMIAICVALLFRNPPEQSALSLKAAEARWASSALHGCAVQLQLQQKCQLPLAIELFTVACDAAAFSLAQAVAQEAEEQGPDRQVKMQRAHGSHHFMSYDLSARS